MARVLAMRERASKPPSPSPPQRLFLTKWLSVICLAVIASRIAMDLPPFPSLPRPSPEWCSLGLESIPPMSLEGYEGPMVKLFAKDPKFMHLLKQGNYSAKVSWTLDLSGRKQNINRPPILIVALNDSDIVHVMAIKPALSSDNIHKKIGSGFNARKAHLRRILEAAIDDLKTSDWSKPTADGHIVLEIRVVLMPGGIIFNFCSTGICFDTQHTYGVDGQQRFERWERLLQNDIHYFTVDANGESGLIEDDVTPRISCILYDSNGKQLCRGHDDSSELC